MKKVLITGANSYIGTSFEKYAIEHYPTDFEIDTVDMIDGSWKQQDFSGYDIVFHVAGIAHSDVGKIDEEKKKKYYAINTDLAIETALKAKSEGVKQFVFMSSAIIYGDSASYGKPKRIDKNTEPNPSNIYGDSKWLADKKVREFADESFAVTVLRPPMVYGRGSKGHYHVLSKISKTILAFPNVQNERSMLYIENLCEFLCQIMERGKGGIFWPQNAEYTCTSEMVKMIAEVDKHYICVSKIWNWVVSCSIHIPGRISRLANKAFGNLSYDQAISKYDFDYQLIDLKKSIEKTERCTNRKVVILSCHTPSLFWFRLDMMKEFIKRGYEVYALANEAEDTWKEKFAEYKIIYRQINVKRNSINPFQDLSTVFSIRKQLSTIRPTKVFTYQAKTVIYGTLAAKSLGIKGVYPLIAGIGSVFMSKSIKSKIVKKFMILLYGWSLKKCSTVFFQNHDDESIFRINRIIKNQKVVFIHGSGVNTHVFAPLKYPEEVAFLCICRLIKDKGIYEYLEACRRIKNAYPFIRCLLVGPLDTNPSALTIKELQPYIDEGIEYYGEQEDVRPFLEMCSVYVLPSYREGTPKTNLEAMACGRAVITTDVPGCRETVIDGNNGFLIPVQNVDSLVEKMQFFIDHPNEASKMGLNGRRMAEELFDVQKVNETICSTMEL